MRSRTPGRATSSPTALELQLLYGMAEPVHAALVRAGHRVRVYAPVGELVPGIAYLVRRLLENTSNESFVRHRFAEGHDLDELIRAPAVDGDRFPDAAAPPVPSATDGHATPPFANEPHAELRRTTARDDLARGINDAAGRPAFDAPVLVDGKVVATDREIVSVDPGCFDRVVCRSGCADREVADAALDAAAAGWPAWRAVPWTERAAIMFRAAAILRARRVELAALEVFEAGKPVPEADADVCEAIDFCEYYGREALRLSAGARVGQAAGEANTYFYEPRGIGVVISPWNFPLAIPAGMVTAALVTGNAVLLKPAEQTPGIALRLVEILHEAGVPPGVLAFLPGIGEEVGAYLVEHPAVAFVAFTGSKAVGFQIIERAAVVRPGQRHIKRVVAEMGGKNPVVVDTDADLDVAVPAITQSAFAYAGQKCSAASRVIAVDPVFDELRRTTGGRGGDRAGRPGGGTAHGVRTTDRCRRTRTRAALPVDRTPRRRCRHRAHDTPDGGWYVGPTIVVTDDPRSQIATDEIFGPVLTVLRATDFDHALALANDTDYALTAGLFSRSPSRIAHANRLAPGGKHLCEPRDHGRARRTSAVRRLRALRCRLQGGRPRLPAAIRRAPRRHREHRPTGLRPAAAI